MNSSSGIAHADGRLLAALALLVSGFLVGASRSQAQGFLTLLAYPEFVNKLYTGEPVSGGELPPAVAFFNGTVGSKADASAPTDGSLTLTQLAFGQAVAGFVRRAPDVLFGEAINIGDSDLIPSGADRLYAPDVDPAGGAFYDAKGGSLYFTEVGFVTVTWKDAAENPLEPQTLLVSSLPVQDPYQIYWTEQGGASTGAPEIDFSSGPRVIVHPNSAIGATHLWLESDRLKAQGRTGLALLEYRNRTTLQFEGVAVVEVRAYLPAYSETSEVGSFLEPRNTAPRGDDARPLVTKGLSDPWPYAYQFDFPDKPIDGEILVARPSTDNQAIEVFWMEQDSYGVVWPYEMARYGGQWPVDFDSNALTRRIYATHDELGARTRAPTIQMPDPPFRFMIHHTPTITTNQLDYVATTFMLQATNSSGRVLLHFWNGATAEFLGIQYLDVRRYLADATLPAAVGGELAPSVDERPADAVPPVVVRGLNEIPDPPGPDYAYQHDVAGPDFGKVFVTRPTTTGTQIELFWMRLGLLGVEWPYVMNRYTADWPADPARYQLFVCGTGGVRGPAVQFPPEKNVALMDFQEPTSHVGMAGPGTLTNRTAGLSLLKYAPEDRVGFQVVRTVLHDDSSVFNLAPTLWSVGSEITNAYHAGPAPGFVYLPGGDVYDGAIYDGRAGNPLEYQTGQIFGVNEGTLEVWWWNLNDGVQWPSLVKRYNLGWPAEAEAYFIDSDQGIGNPGGYADWQMYVQDDPNLVGFNPNDEHARILSEKVYPLRDDLGDLSGSKPYVMVKYRLGEGSWAYRVVRVIAARDPSSPFVYTNTLSSVSLQPPSPLSLMGSDVAETPISGPFWVDRTGDIYARSAGDDGVSTADIVMHYYYPDHPSFHYPSGYPRPSAGVAVPWLDRGAGTPGTPIDVTHRIVWPDTTNRELRMGETLVRSKFGLPDISLTPGIPASVEIIYHQAVTNGVGESVKLIDPTEIREVSLTGLPDDIQKSEHGTLNFFTDLPPHLQKRVWHDADQGLLRFKGEFVESNGAVEPQGYLLPNVLTDRDVAALHTLSEDPTWDAAVDALALEAAEVIEVPPETTFDSLALTAGAATAPGWVTLAFNNNTIGPPEDDQISVAVIYVTCPIYQGELKTLLSDNPFDEKLTMRHTGDFAGLAGDYEFQWIWTSPGSQNEDPTSPAWAPYTPEPADGVGAVDIIISGPGPFTLSDHWFRCRYRPLVPTHPCGTEYSDWTPPQLAPGWIKRVLDGINPYEQRFSDYQKNSVNTIVSMIQQAGPRWTGSVPLNQAAADELGLIEVYETVLKRGMELSIESGTPTEDATVNDALLLAASRIADLYMLLGNEAYADAADPTIAYGTDDGVYDTKASTIHCFQDQTTSLLEEELGLLRGRDDSPFPSVETPPHYNRLIWNFTQGDGEVAYAANYDIRDEQGVVDGVLDEADAKAYYPQGHGDAWGHYLTAIKGYYRLLRNEHFDWVPRSEEVLVGGVPTSVDYQDERRFARVAAARARTGTEVMNLTYRQAYTEDPSGQYQGYYDERADRAWGVSEWASRVGQAALFDWVVASAILPPTSTETGIKKIDRTTVAELRELPAAFEAVQSQLRQADLGLNPLGLAKNVVPFDISPSEIDAGKTHFEQVYTRAVQAMNNAVAVFNYANNSTQLLRRQADRIADFQRTIQDREIDFNNRLIEIFGYPYFEDIGTGKTYPAGYDGPDLYHFAYVDTESLTGVPPPPARDFTVPFSEIIVDNETGTLPRVNNNVTFKLSTQGYEMVKPSGWTQRRAPGELQRSLSELIQTRARFQRALVEYDNLLAQIEDQAALLESQQNVNAEEIKILNTADSKQESLNKKIKKSREAQLRWQKNSRRALLAANALAESLPKVVGIASDISGALRAAALLAGNIYSEHATTKANEASVAELEHQQAKEADQAQTNIKLTTLRQVQGIESQMAQIEQLIRSEVSMRVELFTMEEAVSQSAGNYRAALARGQRLLEERVRFRQQTAAKVQQYRYQDMAFRIFRNDALQKYRAQFDLAARYVYLAAKAYDYETNLREGDSRKPGQDFLTQIMRARTIGEIQDGQPITGTGTGDSGLADPMAQMWGTWSGVLRSQLGFNNPQTETGRFSVRSEFFRIRSGEEANAVWREELRRHVVPNLLAHPEYQRYCVPIPDPAATEPAIVIPFSTTVTFAENLFGWPLGGGDNNFDSTTFATKIRSVGVWLANYNNLGSGLANTPRVYLVPVGHDKMRTPPENTTDKSVLREWKVLDQVLPVPFALSSGDLLNPSWIPINDSLAGNMVDLRRYNFLLAYHDAGYNPSQVTSSSRLIGRSVWNTRWLLIIPAGSLLADRDEAIARFIDGPLFNGKRTGNGVSDIKLYFQTYAYPGN